MTLNNYTVTTILQKTAAGVQEAAHRTLGLQQRERSLLILVNGKKSIAELLGILPDKELAKSLLADLLKLGLVEAHAEPASNQANDSTAAERLSPEQFTQLKLNASHYLQDILGLEAQRLCLLLEACPTKEDFDTRFEKTVNIVAQMKTPAKAAAYKERVLAS